MSEMTLDAAIARVLELKTIEARLPAMLSEAEQAADDALARLGLSVDDLVGILRRQAPEQEPAEPETYAASPPAPETRRPVVEDVPPPTPPQQNARGRAPATREAVRAALPGTYADVMERTGLTKSQVKNALNRLADRGEVRSHVDGVWRPTGDQDEAPPAPQEDLEPVEGTVALPPDLGAPERANVADLPIMRSASVRAVFNALPGTTKEIATRTRQTEGRVRWALGELVSKGIVSRADGVWGKA